MKGPLTQQLILTETIYGKSHEEPGQQIRAGDGFLQRSGEEAGALTFCWHSCSWNRACIHRLAQTPAAREEMRNPEEIPYRHVNVRAF